MSNDIRTHKILRLKEVHEVVSFVNRRVRVLTQKLKPFNMVSKGLGKRIDMWFTGKVDLDAQKGALFYDLMEECKHAAPGARLSYQLRTQLERFCREVRKEIACRLKDGCAPLFIACKRGHVEIVEYLITVCNVDVEQRGLYEVPDDHSVHCVTPLWCAAVSGKLAVIKCLVEHGADVNAISDTGSTPVRSACFMTHLDIVSYLVEHGADILRPNYNGGTCLINSVQSVQLCLYLLVHGASVNTRDIQNKTALHYAIQEHRLETTKLLLDHGADPHARSRYNDDALQTACLKGATQIFDYLIARVTYGPERLADAHELMGSTFLDEHNDTVAALRHWRIATQLRHTFGTNNEPIAKRPVVPPRAAFRNAVEFKTMEDLNNVSLDLDAMRIQSLLICERVLGPNHKDTLFRLMYRGAAYADALRYQRCIELWRRALEIRVEKDTLVQLLLDNGAHLDQPNKAGDCPAIFVAVNPLNNVHLVNYVTLRCLAATAVCKHKIPYEGQIPATLETASSSLGLMYNKKGEFAKSPRFAYEFRGVL
ncbi:hypothetical protein C0J52_00105 [Blattella germanica]|nr:hypothetical protein C0J52_00105 [Blattella germanica]